ncbi:LysR substrate-binding domain-containing protein [Sphingomonas sp.]|uniref:LysR family transcriptional regulator n=1 Tax=Sphingomonas sp. TaxID=28214 RepID=UPI00286C2147|nr:LysR substrate-binding domain-containing protein [Sphingomonas sp.]
MLLRHLRYFSALARERHFARAAVACHVSQPTLSGAIATLEAELGTRLVVRGRRFIDLTPEGRLVLDGARQLLQDEDALLQGLERLRGGLSGVLRLGVIPAAMPVVGMLVEAFCATHPAATVEIRSLSSKAIQSDLHDFELDAGLTYLDNEPLAQVRRTPLYLERYLFATAQGGPLAGRAQISWREAAGQRLCLLSDDMQNRRILNAVFEQQQVAFRPDVVANSFLAVLSQLRTGAWSSIVPHSFGHLFGEQRDIALIPLVEPMHRQSVGLVTSDREPAPPMARALEACAQGVDFAAVMERV